MLAHDGHTLHGALARPGSKVPRREALPRSSGRAARRDGRVDRYPARVAERQAACCEIAMGLTMGYMLITVL
jgi:hypothetical protein